VDLFGCADLNSCVPRQGSIASDILAYLKRKPEGATVPEIRRAVEARRGHVLGHSLRSALYAHLGDSGKRLFEKADDRRNGRYRAR
jgi:hypothetical protein